MTVSTAGDRSEGIHHTERSFSYIEVFMHMLTEKDSLMSLDTDGIIYRMAERSAVMR